MSAINISFTLTSAAAPSEPVPSSSASQMPTKIILYSHAKRFVCVAVPSTHDVRPLQFKFASPIVFSGNKKLTDRPSRRVQDAINIAKESFRELRDVERERISFEVDTAIKKTQQKTQQSRMAEIGPTAWSTMMASPPSWKYTSCLCPPMARLLRPSSHLLMVPKRENIWIRTQT